MRPSNRLLAVVLGFACTAFLAGCASAPTPKTERPAQVDPAVAATLHLYRAGNRFIGAATDHYVYVDGFRVGRLNGGESVETRVMPGEHEIVVQAHTLGIPDGPQRKLTVVPEASQHVYVRYAIGVGHVMVLGNTGAVGFQVGLEPVGEDDWKNRR